MSIKLELIKAGDTLWDCHRYKMGNTTMSAMGSWPVYIVSIDYEKRSAVVKWNGNREQTYYGSQLTRLRRSPIKGTT